jgi:uncharacterized SAM-binding protein YcdF (DUF218 family)
MKGKCFRVFKTVLGLAGATALALLLLAFSSWPGAWYAWLCPPPTPSAPAPAWIVVLGGGGIPSESGLMRCYLGARAAKQHPEAGVLVCLPTDGDAERSGAARMRDEIVLRGVERDRVRLVLEGRSTAAQAREVAAWLAKNDRADAPVRLVSSGYHLRRALGCFRKAGVQASLGTARDTQPDEYDPGRHATLRYRFWNNLGMMVVTAREITAIAIYRLRGEM